MSAQRTKTVGENKTVRVLPRGRHGQRAELMDADRNAQPPTGR